MFDIDFFMATHKLKDRIVKNEVSFEEVEKEMEAARSPHPYIFNVETTNACNMTCVMCPRTTLMQRPITTLENEEFSRIIGQARVHKEERLQEFWDFVKNAYGISFEEPSENSFYFHVVAKHMILHGYGEPMVDKNIFDRVQACTDQGIPTYFSCVPANMTVEKAERLMIAGLGVLKFSIDALEDEAIKAIRGRRANFKEAFQTILDVIDMKEAKGYETILAPTMIELSTTPDAKEMQREFLELWKGKNVFAYIKSQDNRWYNEEDEELVNQSHYAEQYCEYPWTSLTVMANGEVVPCTQDYDTEITFGNIHKETLEEIWNGKTYKEFRQMHIAGNFPKGHKCAERCDQVKLHQYLDGSREKTNA